MPADTMKDRANSNPVVSWMQLHTSEGHSPETIVKPVGDVYGSQHVILYGPDGEAISEVATNTPDMDGQSPTSFNVTAADQVAVNAKLNRRALVLCNDSDTNIYIGLGESVAPNTGIRLNSGGGTIVLSKWGALFTTGAIHAIHGGVGNKVLTIQEMQ